MSDEFEKITSISNPKIKFIKSLLLRKKRSNTGLFLAEGERTCREAILHGWLPKYVIFNVDRDKLSNIEDLLDKCCLLYTSPSPRDMRRSRMPSSA